MALSAKRKAIAYNEDKQKTMNGLCINKPGSSFFY